MKRDTPMTVGFVVLLAIADLLGEVNAGPSPSPIGPISPTIKTLADAEPRRAVSSLPGSDTCLHRIDRPGSYYLTGHLTGEADKNGIEITISNVTLDLMGFSLIGVAGTWDGIIVRPGVRNIVVVNGAIRDWSLGGVHAFEASNSRLRNLHAYRNRLEGLSIGIGSTVTECVAERNGGDGIVTNMGCTVSGCSAWRNGRGPGGGDGIDVGDGSTITACTARDNANAGIYADLGCTVTRCTSRDNTGDGILVGAHSTVTGCTSSFNNGDGFHIGEGATVTACTASLNSGDGIEVSSFCGIVGNGCDINGLLTAAGAGVRVTGLDNRIDGNHLTLNTYGIKVEEAGNLIVRNSAVHNGTGMADDYVIVSGNRVGPITTDPAKAGPWANFR